MGFSLPFNDENQQNTCGKFLLLFFYLFIYLFIYIFIYLLFVMEIVHLFRAQRSDSVIKYIFNMIEVIYIVWEWVDFPKLTQILGLQQNCGKIR